MVTKRHDNLLLKIHRKKNILRILSTIKYLAYSQNDVLGFGPGFGTQKFFVERIEMRFTILD
jgi:hypothetical protein